MNGKTKNKIESDAKMISKLILDTDTNNRGDLFLLIGKSQKKDSQGYTGSLFENMAKEYGLSE